MQHGYGGPPPLRKGPSLGLVVVVCLVGAMFVVPFVIGVVLGIRRVRDHSGTTAKKIPADKVALSETYSTKNGFIVGHYPSDFGAKRVDSATILISRAVGGADEFVTLGAIKLDDAVTDDIEEFARLMLVSVDKNVEAKGGTSEHGEKRTAKCVGKYKGVEFEPSFTLPGIGSYVGRACFFKRHERAYILRYDVVKSHADDAALLTRIIEASDFPELRRPRLAERDQAGHFATAQRPRCVEEHSFDSPIARSPAFGTHANLVPGDAEALEA